MLEASEVSEIEIHEGNESVRISRNSSISGTTTQVEHNKGSTSASSVSDDDSKT